MSYLGAIGTTLLTEIPLLLTLLAGLVATAVARHRLSRRARGFLASGLLVLLLAALLSAATPLLANLVIARSPEMTEVQLIFFARGIVVSLVRAAGVALLIAAVFSRRPATPPTGPHPGAYPAYGTAPGMTDPYAPTPAPR